MPPKWPPKRKHKLSQFIDLTSDSDVENPNKKQKSKALPTPPSNSQPLKSSQAKASFGRSSSFQNTPNWSFSQQQSIDNDITQDVDLDVYEGDADFYDN